MFLSRLDEQQRRWYVGLESKKIGHGGDTLLAKITGMDVETIRGDDASWKKICGTRPQSASERKGAVAPAPKKRPAVTAVAVQLTALVQQVEDETGGDPMGEMKWQRSSRSCYATDDI